MRIVRPVVRTLVLFIVASSLMGTRCRDRRLECDLPQDCASRPWTHPNCTEEEGHWECLVNLCADVCGCTEAAHCDGRSWPASARCTEAAGTWRCDAPACEAVCPGECSHPGDCNSYVWPTDAACPEDVGSWLCFDTVCEVSCPATWCGDGTCDDSAGEDTDNCAQDCATGDCSDPIDCVDHSWPKVCDGRWECQGTACVPVCDYVTCGDETCDGDNGESASSCHPDCFEGTCHWPRECRYEDWNQICQGRWTCFLGDCKTTCDVIDACGDGTCDDALGETGDNCVPDCGGGPCDVAWDCVRYHWYGEDECGGYWDCDAGRGCRPVCDDTGETPGCGDGTCDVLAGESTTSCVTDCQEWDCDSASDCTPLTRPDGCSGSVWACIARVCVPICE